MILFTCSSSQAVHLDLADDASADAFSRVYRRFVARRSSPQLMISDNGSNFQGFILQLIEFQSHPSVKNLLLETKTEWQFIPARAPWFGGMWERLIGISKNVLKRALRNSLITSEELLTIVTEVEARVNDRPLTYIASNSNDCIPITPSHLLHGFRIDSLPSFVEDIDLNDPDFRFDNPTCINKKYRRLLDILNRCWKMWKKDYILALKERDKRIRPVSGSGSIDIKIGDVVLLMDEGPHSRWPLGRVTKLCEGSDKEVRSVELKTKSGISTRPIAKLCFLESSDILPSTSNTQNDHISLISDNGRPARKSALKAQSKIQNMAELDQI